MPTPHPLRLAGLSALLSFVCVHAQNSTWTSGANGTWTNTANWSGGVVANGTSSIATFAPTGSTGITVTNDASGLTLGGIAIGASSIRSTTINSGTITLSGASTPTISLGSSNGSASLSIGSALAGTQGFSYSQTGNARLTLSGNNSGLSGDVTVGNGTIVVGSDTALGTGTVLMSGTLNAGLGAGTRTVSNNFVWNSGQFTNDTGSGSGASGATFRFTGNGTLNGTGINLISSSANADLTQLFRFDGVLSGGTSGNSFTINNGQTSGNVYAVFTNANTFAHNITVTQGGTTPVGGLGKNGSVGILVGNDAALSAATVTVQSGANRFTLASTDGTARTLSNNFVWQTNNSSSGNPQAYQFTFGTYVPVTSNYTTPTAVGSLGGSGNITIGNFDVNAGSGTVAATHRRINVTGSTTATISGVFSRSGTLAAASVIVEKVGTGTLILANAANTFNGGFSVTGGTLIVDGALGGTGVSVGSGAAIGGDGTISTSLSLLSGANFVFGTTDTLTVNGAEVTFGGFSVSNLLGLTSAVADGTYTLIDGTASIVTTNLSNIGAVNAFSLGDGKTAYFTVDTGDLQLVVAGAIPEPSTVALLAGIGVLGFVATRRPRRS